MAHAKQQGCTSMLASCSYWKGWLVSGGLESLGWWVRCMSWEVLPLLVTHQRRSRLVYHLGFAVFHASCMNKGNDVRVVPKLRTYENRLHRLASRWDRVCKPWASPMSNRYGGIIHIVGMQDMSFLSTQRRGNVCNTTNLLQPISLWIFRRLI